MVGRKRRRNINKEIGRRGDGGKLILAPSWGALFKLNNYCSSSLR
jgi:hypothetical protein